MPWLAAALVASGVAGDGHSSGSVHSTPGPAQAQGGGPRPTRSPRSDAGLTRPARRTGQPLRHADAGAERGHGYDRVRQHQCRPSGAAEIQLTINSELPALGRRQLPSWCTWRTTIQEPDIHTDQFARCTPSERLRVMRHVCTVPTRPKSWPAATLTWTSGNRQRHPACT